MMIKVRGDGVWQLVLGLGLVLSLGACSPVLPGGDLSNFNSRYSDRQPALSGDGRFVAFISNRAGHQDLLLFDLETQQFVDLPRLNRVNGITESPSLSQTGRYLVYLASNQGRTDIELYDRITRRREILSAGYRGWVRNPSISPDGRYVTFETARRGQWDIELLDRGPIELDLPPGNRTITPPVEP